MWENINQIETSQHKIRQNESKLNSCFIDINNNYYKIINKLELSEIKSLIGPYQEQIGNIQFDINKISHELAYDFIYYDNQFQNYQKIADLLSQSFYQQSVVQKNIFNQIISSSECQLVNISLNEKLITTESDDLQ